MASANQQRGLGRYTAYIYSLKVALAVKLSLISVHFFFPQQAFIIYLSPVASLVLPAVDRAKSTIVSVFEESGVGDKHLNNSCSRV